MLVFKAAAIGHVHLKGGTSIATMRLNPTLVGIARR